MKERGRLLLLVSLLVNIVLVVLVLRFFLNSDEEVAPAPGVATMVPVVAGSETDSEAADPSPAATEMAAAEVTPTVPPTSTPLPTATATPLPTATATPTVTPSPVPPSPTPTATATPAPDWLAYLNQFRILADLPPLEEMQTWAAGSRLHSQYMVKTDDLSHSENFGSEWFTEAGNEAAGRGNIAGTQWGEADYRWAIDFWMTAPFHALPLVDPQLEGVDFGDYKEQTGTFVYAATLNVEDGLNTEAQDASLYPLPYPQDGGRMWVKSATLYEWPEPLTACPGYTYPVGAPIILQMGAGDKIPNVTGTLIQSGAREINHCVLVENTYVNPSPAAQRSGRNILAARDAVVLIPSTRLEVGEYTVTVWEDFEPFTWSFEVIDRPAE